jgi:uncharacterized repeat protein (TIGR01451 family)
MKTRFISTRLTGLKALAGSFALLALLAFVLPQAAQAATSGGATIYNTVKVTYSSGTTTGIIAVAIPVTLTVNTLAALPGVGYPTGQTTVAGGSVTYIYSLKSNSNGSDTYTASGLTNTPTGVGAATVTTTPGSVTLWGGIVLGSGTDTITVPFGTTAGLSVGSIVQIGATNQYTVTAISATGHAASTDGSGNLIPEVATTITLSKIGSAPAITSGSGLAGTQVGEVKNTALTVAFNAGTPNVVGTDGTYATHFIITTGALPAALNLTTNDVTTTVSSPSVTITKVANPAGTVNYGGTITYTITVTNTHGTASVTSATVIDPIPAYTTYVAGSTTLNGAAVPDVSGNSPLVSPGLVVGTLTHGQVATIVTQVKVQ